MQPKAFHKNVRAIAVAGGEFCLLFDIMCGVLQGCPLSGLLFALAIDPFLMMMMMMMLHEQIKNSGRGEVRACADDIGAALHSIYDLCLMKPIFDLAASVAGLALQRKTCIIVPIAQALTEDLTSRIKAWLAAEIPGWQDFKIQGAALYLGFVLGRKTPSGQHNLRNGGTEQ